MTGQVTRGERVDVRTRTDRILIAMMAAMMGGGALMFTRMVVMTRGIGALEVRLSESIGSLRADVAVLSERMVSLERRMDALEGRPNALEGRIASIEGRVGRIETVLHDRLPPPGPSGP